MCADCWDQRLESSLFVSMGCHPEFQQLQVMNELGNREFVLRVRRRKHYPPRTAIVTLGKGCCSLHSYTFGKVGYFTCCLRCVQV